MTAKTLGEIAHNAKLAIDPNAWMTPAWKDLAPARQRHAEAGAQAVRRAVIEECTQLAERDVDWSRFGKAGVGQWDGGPDDVRDYRIGIATGRTIAAAIRALNPSEQPVAPLQIPQEGE